MSDMTPDHLRKAAQRERDAAQRIIDQYGQGVRPGWVSTDLAIHYERARQYDLRATQIEAGSPP